MDELSSPIPSPSLHSPIYENLDPGNPTQIEW